MSNPHHLEKIMTNKELEERILRTFPDAHFEIVKWNGNSTSSITIKCLDCGKEKTYTRIYGLFEKRKTRFCSNCSETFSQRKVRSILKEKNLNFLSWKNEQNSNGKTIFRVEFECPKCGRVTNRRVWEFLHTCDECSWCGQGHRKKDDVFFKKEINEKFPNQYELLDTYENAKKKIQVKHLDCNFVFEITPDNLLSGKGCPRCNRYNSKGSKTIKSWLEENQLLYETEKTFSWTKQKRYDFYVPKYNLLIEFNGEQHYRPIPFFLQERSFEQQQESDKFKREMASKYGYNFLVIKYDEVEKIPQILSDTTTNLERDVKASALKE